MRQKTKDGRLFVDVLNTAGIIPGIKVDAGAKPLAAFPGEKVTEGSLTVYAGDLAVYFQLGARFAKWRAVIAIDANAPSQCCLEVNSHALARYAALCQEIGLVPHQRGARGAHGRLAHDRALRGSVGGGADAALPPALSPARRPALHDPEAEHGSFRQGLPETSERGPGGRSDRLVPAGGGSVPAVVAGVAFLSGGQPAELATARLNAMNARFKSKMPWPLTFSFSRAVQQPCLESWAGNDANVETAQQALYHRAKMNSAARRGEYKPGMEKS